MIKIKDKNFIDCKDVTHSLRFIRSQVQELYEKMSHEYKNAKNDVDRFYSMIDFSVRLSHFIDINFYLLTGEMPDRKVLSKEDLQFVEKKAMEAMAG